jgi:hypothetical protein
MDNEKMRFSVRFSAEEYAKLKENMETAGFGTMNSYIRKMALDGYIINLDLKAIMEPVKLMRNIAGSMNQIAARINATGSIYAEDTAELTEKYGQLALSVSKIVGYISRLEE